MDSCRRKIKFSLPKNIHEICHKLHIFILTIMQANKSGYITIYQISSYRTSYTGSFKFDLNNVKCCYCYLFVFIQCINAFFTHLYRLPFPHYHLLVYLLLLEAFVVLTSPAVALLQLQIRFRFRLSLSF